MTKRLRRQFALDHYDAKDEKDVCPGEAKCGKFAIARAETGNGLDACAGCSLLPSKLDAKREETEIAETGNYAGFFAVVFHARAHARVNGTVDRSSVTSLQFEMVAVLDNLIEVLEREASARARIAQEQNSELMIAMFKALAGIK